MQIAICDDQASQVALIKNWIEDYPYYKPELTMETLDSGESLLDAYAKGTRFDLIFLDIEMGQVTGVAAAKQIRAIDQGVMIFFVTSYHQYVQESHRLEAVQYLEKPLDQGIFWEDFQRCIQKDTHKHRWVSLETIKGVTDLHQEEIVYLRSDDKYTEVYCANGRSYKVRQPISQLAQTLDQSLFVSCQRSYYVNLSLIELVAKADVITTVTYPESSEPVSIPLSPMRHQAVLAAFHQYNEENPA